MKQNVLWLVTAVAFFDLPSAAQTKAGNTAESVRKAAEAVKTIGSILKKPKGSEATNQNNADNGSAGTMPALTENIFQYPGGAVLFAGGQSSIVLLNGVLYGWGDNSHGPSGNGKSQKNFSPVQITTDNDWKFLSTGSYYNLAIKSDGTLWAWGWGNDGELGLGSNSRVEYPARVGRDTNWVSVAAGGEHSVGIKSNGTLWVWGNNVEERLGIGPTLNSKAVVPVQLNKDTDWLRAIAGDGYTLALKTNGTLWAWGQNIRGALGTKTIYAVQRAPIRIGADNDWAKIFTGTRGYGSFAIKANGSLWAWGFNREGQLGVGKMPEVFSPQQIGRDNNWLSIANQSVQTLGIKADGSLWQWGMRIYEPQRLNLPGKWIAAAASYTFVLAMKSDGTVWTRGNNFDGALGLGKDPYFNTEVFMKVNFPEPVITTKPKAILATVLNEDAALLFKGNKSRLSISDKNKVAGLLGFKLSKDKKQFILDPQSADYPFDATVYPTDMNKDGVEELFILYGNSFTSGGAGSNIVLYLKDKYGDWHKQLGFPGTVPNALTTVSSGYPDLVIGGPGFQFPLYRWNGKDYVLNGKISESQLGKTRYTDIETMSRNLYPKPASKPVK